ncbi:hypothetical protein D3C75_1076090 [compost metagenome]
MLQRVAPGQVARAGHQPTLEATQLAAYQLVIGRGVAQADRQVIAPVKQVIQAVAEVDVQLQSRMLRQKRPQVRGDDPPAELHRQAQAQHTNRLLAPIGDTGIGLVQGLENTPRALVITGAGLGQADLAGGAVEQGGAQRRFQGIDQTCHRRCRQP